MFDVRLPYRLLVAELPHWVKMVYASVRSYQGKNHACYATLAQIGERAKGPKGAMDKGQVSHAISVLVEEGFLARKTRRVLTCNVEEDSTNVEQDSTSEPVEVEQDSTNVDHHSTEVEQDSTPSKNQHRKPKEKTNTPPTPPRGSARVSLQGVWDKLQDIKVQHMPNAVRVKKLPGGKDYAKALKARLAEYGEDAVLQTYRWALTSCHKSATYLRENGYGLDTLLRQSKFPKYYEFSQMPEQNHTDTPAAFNGYRTAEGYGYGTAADYWARQKATAEKTTTKQSANILPIFRQ